MDRAVVNTVDYVNNGILGALAAKAASLVAIVVLEVTSFWFSGKHPFCTQGRDLDSNVFFLFCFLFCRLFHISLYHNLVVKRLVFLHVTSL